MRVQCLFCFQTHAHELTLSKTCTLMQVRNLCRVFLIRVVVGTSGQMATQSFSILARNFAGSFRTRFPRACATNAWLFTYQAQLYTASPRDAQSFTACTISVSQDAEKIFGEHVRPFLHTTFFKASASGPQSPSERILGCGSEEIPYVLWEPLGFL